MTFAPTALQFDPKSRLLSLLSVDSPCTLLTHRGVFEWNNIGNLLADAQAQAIDAVFMLGDHACE